MVNHLLYFDPGTGAHFDRIEVLNKLTDKRYIYSGVKKYLNNLQNDGGAIYP